MQLMLKILTLMFPSPVFIGNASHFVHCCIRQTMVFNFSQAFSLANLHFPRNAVRRSEFFILSRWRLFEEKKPLKNTQVTGYSTYGHKRNNIKPFRLEALPGLLLLCYFFFNQAIANHTKIGHIREVEEECNDHQIWSLRTFYLFCVAVSDV